MKKPTFLFFTIGMGHELFFPAMPAQAGTLPVVVLTETVPREIAALPPSYDKGFPFVIEPFIAAPIIAVTPLLRKVTSMMFPLHQEHPYHLCHKTAPVPKARSPDAFCIAREIFLFYLERRFVRAINAQQTRNIRERSSICIDIGSVTAVLHLTKSHRCHFFIKSNIQFFSCRHPFS